MTHMGRRGTSTISGIPLRAASDLPEGVHLEVPVPLAPARSRRSSSGSPTRRGG